MAGDFNITLEKQDKKHGINVVQKSAENLKSLMTELDLIDIWRHQHPNSHMFAWFRKKPKVMCRLDMFLVRKSYSNNV